MSTLTAFVSPASQAASNIFATPLTGGKALEQKRLEEIRRQNLKKGYVYLGIAAAILAAYSVLFFYPQLKTFLDMPTTLAAYQNKITEYDNVTLPSLTKQREMHKAAYDTDFAQVEDALNKVFPAQADKLEIVKNLENFATALNAKNPPFEFNSITFGEPVAGDGYTILPVSTSIHSSRENFDRFLQLVNLSGKIESEIKVRLMEVSNINIRYRGVDAQTGKDQGVDFTVKLNAYSRS